MIGNDVIDLNLAAIESNWKRKGWIEKVFAPSEREIIDNSCDKNLAVWILWSMKESAYKIYNRNTKIRGYFPQKLVCSELIFEDEIIWGKVSFEDCIFYTKTTINKDFVHTIAVSESNIFDKLNVNFSNNYNSKIKAENIFKDNFGIPFLRNKRTREAEIVSISHHGKFCSYLSTITM
ncbi:4'-phosphopantetheinyl transferase family protein [Flavobacterium sp. 3HN19-14]|uniref:4'-phosphopantetheinyl transferase family protein n=1 Tax=Flavobacterium sp. 3HN19-14 TaxID=3448133 RepID=UPI003EE12F0F